MHRSEAAVHPTGMADRAPHVVIIGGGFGGLTAARALAHAPVRVTVLDRRNHHLFQPLLYQVATAALNPVDVATRTITLDAGEVTYDYLIVATGATHSYFGHDEWAHLAPGLKSVEDAL